MTGFPIFKLTKNKKNPNIIEFKALNYELEFYMFKSAARELLAQINLALLKGRIK